MKVPPNPTDKQYSRLANLFSVLCTVVLALSIAGITTSALALNARDAFDPYRESGGQIFDVLQEGARGPSVEDFDPLATTGWKYQLLPRDIRYGNEKAVLGASVGILVWILAPLITSIFRDVPLHPKYRATGFPGMNVFLTGLCFLAALVAVIYTQTAIQSSTVRVDLSPPLPDTSDTGRTIGSSGTYSVEGWTCGIRKIMTQFGSNGNYDYDVMSASCRTSKAAKWIAVALFVLSTVTFALSFAVVKSGGKANQAGGRTRLEVTAHDKLHEKSETIIPI